MAFYMCNASRVSKIYGVSWDGSYTSSFTRTDDAIGIGSPNPAVNNGNGSSPFDNIWPWAGIRRASDDLVGELVEIPKFYYKVSYVNSTSPKGLKIQISANEFAGSQISPAHMDRGDGAGERSSIAVGRYHCTASYRSETGVIPTINKTRASFRTNIHNLVSYAWQWDYATLLTIQLLYLVEYADWNCQKCIGYGTDAGSAWGVNGQTDNMVYHTGTTAASRNAIGHIQYRYIEDLWSNAYDWCDGIYFSGTNIYAIKNPANFSDTTGGTLVGTRPTTTKGVIKAYNISSVNGFTWFMFPSEIGGTGSPETYVCDFYTYNSSGTVLLVGQSASDDLGAGLFFLSTNNTSSATGNPWSSRLMVL